MEYVYCILLLNEAGTPITEENIAKVLKVADIEPDMNRVKALVASTEGMDIKKAKESPIVAPAPEVVEPEPEPEPKEEETKEEEEITEDNLGMGFDALFGK
jgi:large subunit ribosomal protein L12